MDRGKEGERRPLRGATPDELRLLAFVRDSAPGPRSKSTASTAEMARALGFSPAKVKALRKSAGERGLLLAWERRAESGAQLQNAYRLTRKGRRALAKFEGGGHCGVDAPDPAESSAGEQAVSGERHASPAAGHDVVGGGGGGPDESPARE